MTPTLDLSLNDHNGVVVRRHPLTRDQRLNVRSGSEADATEANVRFDADFVEILFGRALWLHRGENHFATQLIANPDSKNHRGDKRYSTGDVCSPRPPTKSTQSATTRPSARQEAILYTHLTGPEYLSLVGQLRGVADDVIRRRTDGFLRIFDLQDDVDAPMSAYSKGMRQKILIAAALLHDPAVVVLDEPNSGLDVTTTLVLRSLIQALASEGRIVVSKASSRWPPTSSSSSTGGWWRTTRSPGCAS